MKKSIATASLGLALLALPMRAERTLREISWSALQAEGALLGGEVVPARGTGAPESLRVTNADGAARTVPLVTLERPGVKAPRYLLRGNVRGEGIEGQAYLEMWSFFSGGGRYFSRTLAQAGPMASLSGTFGPRPFLLPFTAEPGMALEKLTLGVAFPGRGTVVLGPLRLVELDSGDGFAAVPGAWLTPRQAGLIGGAGGTLFGLVGALVGFLASRARARALVVGLLWTMIGVGVAALAAAALALSSAQPKEVLIVLLLFGCLGTALPASMLGKLKKQYEELELRRMRALDAG